MPRREDPDRDDWLDVVEERMGHAVAGLLSPKGRLRKDQLAQEFGRKTEGEVFDRPSLLALFRLINRNVLETLDYPVSTGKEANVFHGTDPAGRSVAVKIFRVHTATFHSYLTYIQGDMRFDGKKGDRRSIIRTWVRKEYTNLLRLHDLGLRVPEPIITEGSILVMKFVGSEGTPAPLLRDAPLQDPKAGHAEIVRFIETAWTNGGMVHGDLSEYNIMVEPGAGPEGQDVLTVIDVGQAVLRNHPMAREFLARDVRNVGRYFGRLGVDTASDDLLTRLLKPADEEEDEAAEEDEDDEGGAKDAPDEDDEEE